MLSVVITVPIVFSSMLARRSARGCLLVVALVDLFDHWLLNRKVEGTGGTRRPHRGSDLRRIRSGVETVL